MAQTEKNVNHFHCRLFYADVYLLDYDIILRYILHVAISAEIFCGEKSGKVAPYPKKFPHEVTDSDVF